jgi:hypothetical protein
MVSFLWFEVKNRRWTWPVGLRREYGTSTEKISAQQMSQRCAEQSVACPSEEITP